MKGAQRLALIVAAAALLVGGFLVAQGSEEDASTTAPGTPAETAATPTQTTAATAPATTAATPAVPVKPTTPVVTVTGGRPIGGVRDLRFAKGDEVRFAVRSDVADEIHVHGYDVTEDVEAGGRVTFAFTGDIDGIFEVELEGAGRPIASLRVSP